MEIQTAINIITDIMRCALGSHPYCDRDCDFCAYRIDDKSAIREAFDIALDSLNNRSEAEEYRTPMKVVYKLDDSSDHTEVVGICPRCHGWEQLYDGERFCSECGQAIDWSEVGI